MARKNLFNIAEADNGRPAFEPASTPEPVPTPSGPPLRCQHLPPRHGKRIGTVSGR